LRDFLRDLPPAARLAFWNPLMLIVSIGRYDMAGSSSTVFTRSRRQMNANSACCSLHSSNQDEGTP